MSALAWQRPTAWSYDTPDGEFYIERQANCRGFSLFRRRRIVANFGTVDECKARAEKLAGADRHAEKFNSVERKSA